MRENCALICLLTSKNGILDGSTILYGSTILKMALLFYNLTNTIHWKKKKRWKNAFKGSSDYFVLFT